MIVMQWKKLKQWGKLKDEKCVCSKRQTIDHILNGCKVSLNQGRFNLRHDSILSYTAKCLDRQRYTCYFDIPGFQTPAGGTLPADIIVATFRPDIVLVDNRKKSIAILELSSSFVVLLVLWEVWYFDSFVKMDLKGDVNHQFPPLFLQFRYFYEEQRIILLEGFEKQRGEMFDNFKGIVDNKD